MGGQPNTDCACSTKCQDFFSLSLPCSWAKHCYIVCAFFPRLSLHFSQFFLFSFFIRCHRLCSILFGDFSVRIFVIYRLKRHCLSAMYTICFNIALLLVHRIQWRMAMLFFLLSSKRKKMKSKMN